MNLHQFARAVLMPLFILNMAAIIATMYMKRRFRKEFSANIDRLFVAENLIGIACALALALIAFFAK